MPLSYQVSLLPILIITLVVFAYQAVQPPTNLRPKVFVIGLSKTGTTSIGDALALLGYRRLGWKDVLSRHLVHAWRNGDMDRLFAQTLHYDAFEDLPWAVVYPEMAKWFSDAKFILSLRTDEAKQLKSMRRHVGRSE
ncbi:hypothetical protein LTS18_003570 [Coniosporium uncinatum]|uniref:Uncharacterized protein n=1 Tax=Coniosporium uncinatum TaxID=93489 RepID=A0ACC3DTI5_9PEZI|nr:hypothetical protein LTS18_003570 [Coniosporium uncinatum]